MNTVLPNYCWGIPEPKFYTWDSSPGIDSVGTSVVMHVADHSPQHDLSLLVDGSQITAGKWPTRGYHPSLIIDSSKGGSIMEDQTIKGTEAYHTTKKDASSYEKGYDIFLRRNDFRERVANAAKVDLPRLWPDLGKRAARVLDIGSGDGKMTLKYLEALRAGIADKLDLSLVEPSENALRSATELMRSHAESIHGIPKTAEDYFSDSVPSEARWDWIIASYVFYHIDSKILYSMLNSLAPTGLLMVAMGAPGNPLRSDPVLKAISKHGDFGNIANVLNDEAVKARYNIHQTDVSTRTDLRGLLNANDELTEEGVAFFSFIYNSEVTNFTPEQMAALKRMIHGFQESSNGWVAHTHYLTWISPKP